MTPERNPRVPRWVWLGTAALIAFVTVYSRPYLGIPQPNALSRLYLTEAMMRDGRLDLLGAMKRHGIIYDFAYRKRPFSDKAPGSSILAIPAYGAARLVRPAEAIDTWTLLTAARLIVLVPVSLLTSLVLLPRALRQLHIDERVALTSGIALSVGTIQLTYSQVYVGHVLAGAFLLLGLLLAVDARGSHPDAPDPRRLVGAGAACGMATLVEYQSALPAAMLLALSWQVAGRRGAARLALGALPFALALAAYDWRCFGSPFSLSYEHVAFNDLKAAHASGYVGVTWPRPGALLGLVASRHRGLLFWSPVILLAPFGVLPLWKRHRPVAAAVAGTMLCYLLLVSASTVWEGGWALGPRLLVPMFPFAMIATSVAIERARARPMLLAPGLACILYGMSVVPLATAVLPGQAPVFSSPLADLHWSLLRCGMMPTNLGHHLGLPGHASLIPLGVCITALGGIAIWAATAGVHRGLHACIGAVALASLLLFHALGARTLSPAQREQFFDFLGPYHRGEPHREGKPALPCTPARAKPSHFAEPAAAGLR